MSSAFDRPTRHALLIAAAVCALSLLAFVFASERVAQRVAALKEAASQAAELANGRLEHVAAWTAATPRERAFWEKITAYFSDAVGAGEVRLVASAEVTALALRCGLRELQLREITADELPEAGAGEAWRDASELLEIDSPEAWGEEAVAVDPARAATAAETKIDATGYGFRLEFRTGFPGLVRFLEGLQELPAVVELRAITIERDAPDVQVGVTLVTYGRQT